MSDQGALCELTITAISEEMNAGRLSSLMLTDAYLERIEATNNSLAAFVHVAEDAREQALAVDNARANGRELGPLAGIPIAVKDNYLTRGMPTEAGSEADGVRYPADRDATAVAKLRNAGAVLIGKTRMHEFAWGMETPPARNPWDTNRVPGGSSGGSGVAVASGMAAAALGSDTGGSIRIPAALCGTVGLKPTFGLIGRAGIIPHSWSLDHAGPLTSSVADAALLTQVMAGHDPDDASSVERVPINLVDACDEPVEGLTVGVCRNHFFDSIDDDVSQTVENIINKLSASGAVIRDFTVPELAYGLGAIYAIELASSTAYHRKRLAKGIVENFQPDVRLLVEMGSLVSGVDYLQAERYRTLLGEKFKDAFAKIDVVLSPTMPLTAWEIGQRSVNLGKSAESVLAVSWRLTYPWNLLGLPAISVPCGVDHRGLPIGLQIAGPAFREDLVLRTAANVESIMGGPFPKSPVPSQD